jgi:hypothetical protein
MRSTAGFCASATFVAGGIELSSPSSPQLCCYGSVSSPSGVANIRFATNRTSLFEPSLSSLWRNVAVLCHWARDSSSGQPCDWAPTVGAYAWCRRRIMHFNPLGRCLRIHLHVWRASSWRSLGPEQDAPAPVRPNSDEFTVPTRCLVNRGERFAEYVLAWENPPHSPRLHLKKLMSCSGWRSLPTIG